MVNRFFVRGLDLRRHVQIVLVGVVCWACSASQPPPAPSSLLRAAGAPATEVVGGHCVNTAETAYTEDESMSGELVGTDWGGPFVVQFIRAIRRNPMLAPPLAASLKR